MRFFAGAALVIGLAGSLGAQAATSKCANSIIEDRGWSLTPAQSSCTAESTDLQASLAYLCSADQRDFSNIYKSYRPFKIQSEAKLRELQSATEDSVKAELITDLQTIDMRWKVEGFKNEVEAMLFPFSTLMSKCTR